MKKVFIILAILCIGVKGFSQQDSTKTEKRTTGKNGNRCIKEEMEQWERMDSSEWHGDMHPGPCRHIIGETIM